LQHERALQILCAVQTARKLKVAFEQRARAFESFDYLFVTQIL